MLHSVVLAFRLDSFEEPSTFWAGNAGGTCVFGGRHLSISG